MLFSVYSRDRVNCMCSAFAGWSKYNSSTRDKQTFGSTSVQMEHNFVAAAESYRENSESEPLRIRSSVSAISIDESGIMQPRVTVCMCVEQVHRQTDRRRRVVAFTSPDHS